jgi:hypothetical protein
LRKTEYDFEMIVFEKNRATENTSAALFHYM